MVNKQELRKTLRQLRTNAADRDAQSAVICKHILNSSIYMNARVIAAYSALPHEADVTDVVQAALIAGKTVAMPRCGAAPVMQFHRICSMDELRAGRYGIFEPSADAPVINEKDLELILVPLEGIDARGFRLGKGGGYYDHLINKTNAYTIGCALDWQILPCVPNDPWDKQVRAYADVNGLYEIE